MDQSPRTPLIEHQRRLAFAGKRLGELMAQAGERSFDVPAELWTQIARLATEVAVHAQALADRGEEV